MALPVIPLALIGAGLVALFWPDKKESAENDTVSENGDGGGGSDTVSQLHPDQSNNGVGGVTPRNKRAVKAAAQKGKDQENVGLEPPKVADDNRDQPSDDNGGEHGAGTSAKRAPESVAPEKPAPKKPKKSKGKK